MIVPFLSDPYMHAQAQIYKEALADEYNLILLPIDIPQNFTGVIDPAHQPSAEMRRLFAEFYEIDRIILRIRNKSRLVDFIRAHNTREMDSMEFWNGRLLRIIVIPDEPFNTADASDREKYKMLPPPVNFTELRTLLAEKIPRP